MSCHCCGFAGKVPFLLTSLLAMAVVSGTTSFLKHQPAGGNNRGLPELASDATSETSTGESNVNISNDGTGVATFGGGCFWCVEAVFLELKGVKSVKSGYMGGTVENPTYQQVCTGKTGHAEVVQVEYNPDEIAFEKLLEVFFLTHDPTTLNRQGNDYGPQYRSAVFYHDDGQRQAAEKIKARLDEAGIYDNPIVTEVTAAGKFYPAEDYHQNYFARNPNQPYCQAMIPSKIRKVHKVFAEFVKD
jgi:peptide-methionine (S)-S-oxide reductase